MDRKDQGPYSLHRGVPIIHRNDAGSGGGEISIALASKRPPGVGLPPTQRRESRLSSSHGVDTEPHPLVPRLRRRILIAEDDAGLRQSLNELLSTEGYVVLEAEDGKVALDLLAGSPVDVLLLDLAMPHVNGLELLRRIHPPPPVVIIYSALAYFDPEEVQRQVGAKIFKALRKPVPPNELLEVVAASVEELDNPG